MRLRLPWALLAISVALNLFFVGGVVYSKLQHDSGGDHVSDAHIAAVSEELGLSEAERDGLLALRTTLRERWQGMRGSREQMHGAMVDALLDPAFDHATALELAKRRSEPRDQAVADSMVALHGYLAGLSEEQRQKFITMAQEPRFFRELFGRARPRPKD
ncbi:MAG: Spy/CpxP family protein refolding chaperone [Kiloniellales bacterium]